MKLGIKKIYKIKYLHFKSFLNYTSKIIKLAQIERVPE